MPSLTINAFMRAMSWPTFSLMKCQLDREAMSNISSKETIDYFEKQRSQLNREHGSLNKQRGKW
ncbi:hypothetical protein GALMADRAFT_219143 [Galerina marginata CBS 339.88]|uniref:Uncharacterized protein n=1 Tax=Galerina marginata (strain CBS 339.88) TaxID=685588 RepID=A0A067U3W2_GALM3|nr:hypothetical protein GALMADRAFT_219143 [Galerina marginata CBS 339.88]